MKSIVRYISVLLCVFSFTANVNSQSLTHPHIWTNPSERQVILNKISSDINKNWSGKLYNDLKVAIDPLVALHKINPGAYLSNLPELDKTKNTRKDHSKAIYDAAQASFLYFLDQNNDYAQFAADILSHYTIRISAITGDLWFSKNGRWVECRDIYPKIGMTYDFIQPFLTDPSTTVYNYTTNTRTAFDQAAGQTTFMKLADEVISKGYIGSNHPVLEANGALFNLLCIENDSLRFVYFNDFINGTPNQDGLITMLNTIKYNDYLWPESTSYSKETFEVVLHLLNVVDMYDPGLKLVNLYRSALKGAFLYENLKYPNKSAMIRFGDSRRAKHKHTENLYLRVLAIAHRKGLNTYKNLAISRLQGVYNNDQYFKPSIANESLEWVDPTQLFWGVDVDFNNNSEVVEYFPSAKYPHAGVGVLRNYTSSNIETFGLMGYIGGGHYVHSHLTGIEMELYGAGMVMGAGGGEPKSNRNRSSKVNMNYNRIYAGHNTVIVNGDSKGQGKDSWKWDNILYQNTCQIIAIEPDVNMDQTNKAGPINPVSEEFSFLTVALDDKINDVLQERTLSLIRTSETTGYYLDVFRSKSNDKNNFHDYIYHNYGESLSLLNSDANVITNGISLSDQTRFSSHTNIVENRTTTDTAHIEFPGWQYFKSLEVSNEIDSAITGKFNVDKIGAFMHFKIPKGTNRDYTKCIGPPILETESSYLAEQTDSLNNDSAQVLVIRQSGEAWERPFIIAFEPSKTASTIQSIENLTTGNSIVGAKVISIINGRKIVDFIIAHDNAYQTFDLVSEGISFAGRFAVIRKYKNKQNSDSLIKMYIGEGVSLLVNSNELIATGGKAAYVEFTNLVTLPIELIDFSALLEGDKVAISWKTVSEINNCFFQVERSLNGIDFEVIEIVSGAGNSNDVINYTTYDASPHQGISYYRIRQIDFDGENKLFDVKSVNIAISDHTNWAHSTAFGSHKLNIFGDLEGDYEVMLIDINGKIIFNKSFIVTPNNKNSMFINLPNNLNNGVYLVHIKNNGFKNSGKILIRDLQ